MYVSIHSDVFYIPPRFLTFHIPLIFAMQQLKISEICTLFQPIQLQIFSTLKTGKRKQQKKRKEKILMLNKTNINTK